MLLDLAAVRPGVPEIFSSIQGEGPQQGLPRVFVRLSRCNLYCRWCDTPYTWNWQDTPFVHDGAIKYDRSANSVALSVQDVANALAALPEWPIVFTGGEPMLQQKVLVALVERLQNADESRVVEVETNGTVCPDSSFDSKVSLYVVSPKLSNSTVPARLRLRDDATSFFARSAKARFKFVVSGDGDLEEVLRYIHDAGIPPSRVYLMPEGTDAASLDKTGPEVAARCVQHGFAYSDRLHLRLFGEGRGV